jgi:hypothetical protein
LPLDLPKLILELLIRFLQLLYLLPHRRRLPVVLSNEVLVGIVDLVAFPGLIPDLLDLIPQATQLVALVNYYLPLPLVGVHYLRELPQAQLREGQLFLETLPLVPLRQQGLLELEPHGDLVLEDCLSVVNKDGGAVRCQDGLHGLDLGV